MWREKNARAREREREKERKKEHIGCRLFPSVSFSLSPGSDGVGKRK